MRRECRERFPPSPIKKNPGSLRSRHASRHVRDARAVMHVGIAHLRWWGKRSRYPRRMRTRNFAYLARGPCGSVLTDFAHVLQDYFTGTKVILGFPRCQWSIPDECGSIHYMKNGWHKHSDTLCIIYGTYSISLTSRLFWPCLEPFV